MTRPLVSVIQHVQPMVIQYAVMMVYLMLVNVHLKSNHVRLENKLVSRTKDSAVSTFAKGGFIKHEAIFSVT